MIYEAAEDSFLLQKTIKPYAEKAASCLDVGTGSGVQAVELRKHCNNVLAVDINPEVIQFCKKEFLNIEFRLSDLFENIEETFDLITFNPPYLPNEAKDPDIALDGGPEGWELIKKFLEVAKSHLNKNGTILLLFSSFSKTDKVLEILKKENYSFKEIAKTHIHFEDLFVYELKI